MLRRLLRLGLRRTFWPDGAIRTVLIGPSKGLAYRLYPDGLAPIFGRWEPELQRLLLRLLRPGDVAYDVGANYGIHTLLMARLVGKNGTVCTFEPHPRIFAACKENVEINGFQSVRLFNMALGSAVGQVPFVIGHHDAVGHISTGSQESSSFDVACETMDHLVVEGATPGPNLIKIDVEGHESRVLAGAETVFRKFRPLLAVELHTPDQDREVGRFLKGAGYCAFHQNSLIEVRNMESGWPDPDGMQGQILAIPKEKVADYSWLIKLQSKLSFRENFRDPAAP